jgi:hypothetical protein
MLFLKMGSLGLFSHLFIWIVAVVCVYCCYFLKIGALENSHMICLFLAFTFTERLLVGLS